MLELLIAIMLLSFALRLSFDFSQRYTQHLDLFPTLNSIGRAQVDLLSHVASQDSTFSTTNLTCTARLIRTSPPVIYQQFLIKDCQ